MDSTSFVAPLTEVGGADLSLVGGKAANLGELLRAGFVIPPGFVVTTAGYRAALSSAGLCAAADAEPTRLRAAIAAMTLPPELAAALLHAYRQLGEGAVAVRSSATAEDLPGAAFAGQQDTFLNVVGSEELLAAVLRCWASLWGDRAVAYRARLRYPGEPEIAVVVQRMVPSELAGVLFTANPVTGRRDEVVIEASAGLGEAVVSGLVTPEHVVLDRQGRVRERRAGRGEVVVRGQASGGVVQESGGDHPGEELPAAVVAELGQVGVRIGEHFGRPQDVEWAYAEHRLWVVQARPLTALPPAPVQAGRVARASGAITAELLPTRPYPLDVTAWTLPGWFSILARMAGELVAVRIDVRRMLPEVDGVVTQLLPPEPHLTRRTLTAPLRLRDRARRFDPARWTSDPRFAAYERQVRELQARDHARLTWSELVAEPDEVLQLLDRYVDLRIDHLPAAAVALVRLRLLLGLLGLSGQFWALLDGQPTQTRAANDALQAVAEEIRRTPSWAEAFASMSEEDLVAAVWDGGELAPLRPTLQRWLDAFGHRETTSAALLSAPTWADSPELLLGNLRGLVAHPAPPTREASGAEQRVRDRWRVRLTGTGDRVSRTAAAARAALVFREDSHFHALRLRPVLRGAVLEAGERLRRADVLARPADVFHLRLAELREVRDPARLDAEQRDRLRQLVHRRAERRAELGEGPIISPATLYPGVRRPSASALVSGTPGGGGRASGPVRVIREPGEFGRLQPGDVLVCPYTNPAWTPLFQLAAAVVADSGSFGSHAAIVAREYGIPAVMGTGNGTRVLADGQPVVVDGSRGDVVPSGSAGRS